jgi:diacylglycerol O-acyltransferase / wax synthase
MSSSAGLTSGPSEPGPVPVAAPASDRPRRLLVVSATIGEGHNATAAAVEERARALWPRCEIRRVDTLELMGRATGPAFRWIYRTNVDRTPWLYDFFYRELWRRPWFASASSRFTGAWAGRALRPVVAEYRPDLVVSTYPLGTGGMDWLRRHGGMDAPLAAIISDFAPHPFWVYPEVDLHYVASEPSLRAMWRAQPDAKGAVGAPPVVSAFGPADRKAARAALGLPVDAPIALVSCGSLGFGSVERAVQAALAAHPALCVVVTCGRNETLRARLAARGEPTHRLVPMGWTDRMPELVAAADAVITNAGGATALEALATGRIVLLFEPIAGHGKANAALMETAGLGRVCPDAPALTDALRSLLGTPELLAAAERRAVEHTRPLDFDSEVAALPALPRHHGARRLAPSDALFVNAATAEVPQQLGAVITLEPLPSGAVLDPDRVAARLGEYLAQRAYALPMLRRRLWTAPGRWPRWLAQEDVDPARHVDVAVIGTVGASGAQTWDDAAAEFFDTPVPRDRPPWRLRVLADRASGRIAVLAAMHHALGDGLAITATLSDLLDDAPAPVLRPVPSVPEAAGGVGRVRLVEAARLARGLFGLATAGRAAVGAAGVSGPARRYVTASLPGPRVRAVARSLRTSTTALLLGVLGEALHRHGGPVTTSNGRLRTAVPLTTRRVRHGGDAAAGNDTAAVMLDLPVGVVVGAARRDAVRRRITLVAAELARLERAGHRSAAGFAVRALGLLPAVAHRRVARLVYGGRFFSMIASVMPGRRRELRALGGRVCSVHPVLPLANGVGLAVGFVSWGEVVGVGVTADRALFGDPDRFAETLVEVFHELAGVSTDGGVSDGG